MTETNANEPTPPDKMRDALAIVNEQAEDEGLWFVAEYITEAYLQKALRRLHAAVESEFSPPLQDTLARARRTIVSLIEIANEGDEMPLEMYGDIVREAGEIKAEIDNLLALAPTTQQVGGESDEDAQANKVGQAYQVIAQLIHGTPASEAERDAIRAETIAACINVIANTHVITSVSAAHLHGQIEAIRALLPPPPEQGA